MGFLSTENDDYLDKAVEEKSFVLFDKCQRLFIKNKYQRTQISR